MLTQESLRGRIWEDLGREAEARQAHRPATESDSLEEDRAALVVRRCPLGS